VILYLADSSSMVMMGRTKGPIMKVVSGGSQMKNEKVERIHLMITMLKMGLMLKANIQWSQAVRARKKQIKKVRRTSVQTRKATVFTTPTPRMQRSNERVMILLMGMLWTF
jgi:hypothetical protein